jgi:hypothetical protein
MAVIQVNPPGMTNTTPGYISSITVRTGGAASVLVPNATTGQITVEALAATQLVQQINKIKLITG